MKKAMSIIQKISKENLERLESLINQAIWSWWRSQAKDCYLQSLQVLCEAGITEEPPKPAEIVEAAILGVLQEKSWISWENPNNWTKQSVAIRKKLLKPKKKQNERLKQENLQFLEMF